MTVTASRWRRVLVAPALAGALVVTASCTDEGADGPPEETPEVAGPEQTAQQLADALNSGDVAGLPFVQASGGTAAEDVGTLVEDMGGIQPRFELTGVTEGAAAGEADSGTATGSGTATDSTATSPVEDVATAELSVVWDVDESDSDWAYDTDMGLVRAGDAWRVQWDGAALVPELAGDESLAVRSTAAPRADIETTSGEVLVTDRDVVRVGIDKAAVEPEQALESAGELAAVLGIDPATYRAKVEGYGEEAFVEALVARDDGSFEPLVSGELDGIPGVLQVPDTMPLAPTREFARPLLGTVGPVTAEMVEESEGEYEANDVVGLSGLQQTYDDRLAGGEGVQVLAVSTAEDGSTSTRELFAVEPEAADPLVVTLDVELQREAEELLADVESPSAIVALRPSTGYVLATASGPGGQGYSTATVGQYAPGSTFKIVSSLALLRQGVSAQDELECAQDITVDGARFTNNPFYPTDALGTVPLRTAFAQSCNTAFISQAGAVTQAELQQAAASLGWVDDPGLGFEAFLGRVPDEGGASDHAATMIGQGRVLASPLGLATVAASVTEGRTVVPRLLPDRDAPDASPQVTLEPGEAEQLRGLMAGVTAQGSGDFLQDVPGEPVLSKSGTAEVGSEDGIRLDAWMVGAQGDLAVAVLVQGGGYGSEAAGPILGEFLRAAGN